MHPVRGADVEAAISLGAELADAGGGRTPNPRIASAVVQPRPGDRAAPTQKLAVETKPTPPWPDGGGAFMEECTRASRWPGGVVPRDEAHAPWFRGEEQMKVHVFRLDGLTVLP